MDFGFDFPRIVREVFDEKTRPQQSLLGRAITGSVRFLDGRAVAAWADRKTLRELGASSSDTDGIVSALRNTRGVEAAAFLYETEPGVFKASLRSRERADVSRIAVRFGGGGHIRAAGCTVKGAQEEVLAQVKAAFAEEFSAVFGA